MTWNVIIKCSFFLWIFCIPENNTVSLLKSGPGNEVSLKVAITFSSLHIVYDQVYAQDRYLLYVQLYGQL